MNRRNLYPWRMLILAIAMLATPMLAAAATPGPVTPNPLYPAGIGFNPVVDYNKPNFAQSPNIRKFVDKLPGLGSGSANLLGQYIPVAVPDTTSFPGSDYYEIGLKQYTQKMNSDLPATEIRGYYQINTGTAAGTDHAQQYLGPLIIASKNKAVRVKFVNQLGTLGTGNLPLPVDTTIMGAGMGPANATELYTQNRADLHLHGGATPWISDGTPHQWITPALETTSYPKGASFQNVPDMVTGPTSIVNGVQVPCAASGAPTGCFLPANNDGSMTYYWTNQQSARLMFYHDHAYGITRLNVYAGEAAGYLLTDDTEQDLISGTTNVSGVFTAMGIAPTKILPSVGIPLVIQDKTFVNASNTPPGAGFPAAVTGYVPTPLTLTNDPLWAFYVPPYDGTTAKGGNFWIGHEYMPVENPNDPTGNTPYGRWDYAPFMIPAMVPLNLTLPSPTIIPEGFQDTAIVNGTAFPYVELPPAAVRFRILNACNDRTINLQVYKADPLRINVTNGGSGYLAPPVVTIGGPGTVTSATATVVGTAVTAITVTGATGFNPATPPTVSIAAPASGTTATAAAFVGTEVAMVPAAPNAAFPTWPRDGRDGGVPDPLTKGPDWLQIGNEAGFLAKVAVVPQQPIDYIYNRQVIPLAGVSSHSLLLMPAMRADVLLDLSGYTPGDTLLVYNDAPAAMPNFWPINDYYTDDPDQTAVGGAPTTPAGFGPNTRTIMQIRIVAGTVVPVSPNLTAAIPAAFRVGQDPILVPQNAYNLAYPSGPLNHVGPDNFVKGYQTTMNISGTGHPLAEIRTTVPGNNYTTAPTVAIIGGFPATGCTPTTCIQATATAGLNPAGGVTLLTAGSGYVTPPTVTIGLPAAGGVRATALATISGGTVNAISIVQPGSNYTNIVTAPTCTISAPPVAVGNTTATCSVTLPTLNTVGSITLTNPGVGYVLQPQVYLLPTTPGGTGASADALLVGDLAMTGKNLSEGFDVDYGRMDIRLGSTPNPLTPNVGNGFVIGIARYIDPPTEIMNNGEVILWRLAHLGVDSHAMHFHLFNLQMINRIDWTNGIKPPYDDEIGWRETIRTNPMEDIIVAIKPQSQTLPFPIPNSVRVLDPTTPLNSTTNFLPVPPPVGIPAVAQVSNVLTNFGWEYVWHCHLLGHEENDMMRPLVLVVLPPPAPTALTATVNSVTSVTLNWTTTATDAAGYIIQRATNNTFTTGLATFIVAGTATNTYTDTTALASTNYFYRVQAYNGSGSSAWSNVVNASTILPAPTALTATVNSATSVTLNWTTTATFATGYTIQRATNAAFTVGLVSFNAPGTATTTYTNTTTVANTRYYYRVQAYITSPVVTTAWSNVVIVITVVPPGSFTAAATRTTPTSTTESILFNWTNTGTVTSYTIQIAINSTFSAPASRTAAAAATSLTWTGLGRRAYYSRIRANTAVGSSAWVNNAAPFPVPIAP